MQILNKYKRWNPQILLRTDEIWDFVLSQDTSLSIDYDDVFSDECLISFIDTKKEECIDKDNNLISVSDYIWENAKNEGNLLEDIGYTGIDNGLILYQKDKISNFDFYKIFTQSKLHLEKNDFSLKLHPVSGNTGLYKYPYEIVKTDKEIYMSFKGGFYQGFYKLHGFDYQVLPNKIENYWGMEFVIRPKDYEEDENTLNSLHPENKGIFFFMGARAENKFIQAYNYDLSSYEKRKDNRNINHPEDCDDFLNSSYFLEDYLSEEDGTKETKLKPVENNCFKDFLFLLYDMYPYDRFICCNKGKKEEESEVDDDFEYSQCKNGEYILTDLNLNNVSIKTSNGINVNTKGYFEFETDNKYLIFNQTPTGFTTDTWKDGDKFVLTGTTPNNKENLFLLLNNTPTGYTTDTIESYFEKQQEKEKPKLYKDTNNNAFALKINDDGSIGYRYMVSDCDSEERYKIIEEKSFPNIVKKDEWNTIFVAFQILNGSLDQCNKPIGERTMKIYIYVNGKLKFISKELPEFKFKELDEMKEKQEGVPYNISIGGGTQGLCDSIWIDYYKIFEPILPIEKNFAGTFIGDFKSFKFYNCFKQVQEIRNNFLSNKTI